MGRKVVGSIVLVLIVLGVASCNLSDLSSVLTATPDVRAETSTPIIVEVTPTPQSIVQTSLDVEEQLVTSLYARVSPAVVCITAPERFG
ncbi:MAG: hypothetical protein ACK2UU_16055, partial [Anaerolineae bacterium]